MVLESANKKVQEICDILREETLTPARREAKKIVEQATWEAEDIIAKAKAEVERIQTENERKLEQQNKIHHSSLQLAVKQAVSKLKQSIVEVFSTEWESSLKFEMKKDDVIVKLVEVMINAIDKEGLGADLMAIIPHEVSVDMIANQISMNVKEKLKTHEIKLGNFKAGAQIKLVDEKVVIDMTEESIVELLKTYVSDEIRHKIFANSN